MELLKPIYFAVPAFGVDLLPTMVVIAIGDEQ